LIRIPVLSIAAAASIAAAQPAAPDETVTLVTRDAPLGIRVVVLSTDTRGVLVRVLLGSERESSQRRIPWTEVRIRDGAWAPPEVLETIHTDSLLAAARRDRGDIRGAAEPAGSLAPGLVGTRSVQASEVFGILVEDALSRLDLVEAAHAVVAPGEPGPGWMGYDARWSLHTLVPFVPSPASRDSWDMGSIDRENLPERDRLILDLMDAVQEGAEGSTPALLERAAATRGDPGIELAALMVAAQTHPDAEERARARDRLSSRASMRSGSWIDAWARLAIAESHARSGTQAGALRALVELSHLIVRFHETHPVLARLAARRIAGIGSDHGLGDETERLERAWRRLTTPNRTRDRTP